jgi:hypothetical protein
MKDFIMAIPRKLFFFILINLACALNAKGDTYITNQALPYDVITPKAALILDFAQIIYPPFSSNTTHKELSEWLTKGIANYVLNNITIINIASIIESDTTLETKIASLLVIQADWDIQQAQYHRNDTITTRLFFMFFAAIISVIIYDIIKKNKAII